MSGTMDVTARLRGDNASFDSAQKKSAEVAAATSNALQRAAKKAADAQAFASKFAGDSVDRQSIRMVQALAKQRLAQQEYSRMQGIAKAGYLGEAEAAKVTAAALQRLAAAKELAAKAGGGHERAFASVRESIGGLRFGEAFDQVKMFAGVAVLAELANKMREAVSESLEFAEAMQRASVNTGLTVQTLSTMHHAALMTGGDFDAMTAAAGKMSQTIAQATQGNKAAMAFMKQLGLNAQELAGRSDGAEVAFHKFLETMGNTEAPIRRIELATGLMGKTAKGQIDTLVQLGKNWDAFSKQAQDAGRMLDGPTAAALTSLNQRLKNMQEAVRGAGLSFTEGLAPGLSRVLDVIAGGRGSMNAMQTWGRDTSKAIALVAEVAYSAASALEFMFGASELGKFTEAGRRDIAAAKELQQKAQEFHDIAFAKGALTTPAALIPEAKTKGSNEGFEGIGDQHQHAGNPNKAAEDQMKSFEDMLNHRKADEQLAVVDELNFWEAMLAPAAKYPQNIQKIYEKLGTLTQDYYRLLDSLAAKAVEAQKRAQQQMQQQDAQMLSMMKQWEEQDSRRATSQAKLAEAQQRVGDAAMEQSIKFKVMTGQISQHAAALQLAALHAADYRAQLEEIDREAAEDAQRSTLTPDERDTRSADRDIRRVTITGEMNRTSAQDQQDISNSTILGGATDALREFTASALDSSKQMREFVSNALSQVNDAILGDGRGRFKQAGGEILKGGARSLLQEGEGHLLSAVGINSKGGKKPTGAAGDPIHVFLENQRAMQAMTAPYAAQMASSGNIIPDAMQRVLPNLWPQGNTGGADAMQQTPSSLNALLWPGGPPSLPDVTMDSSGAPQANYGTTVTSNRGSGIGSLVGGLIAKFLPMIPGFANGGPITANTAAIIGERGPELFMPRTSGTIVPNSQLPDMGGGDTHQYFIDASGSTDPAQTEATVHRVMSQYVPGIVKASVGATRDAAMRRPRTVG